jgi:hypothetical protein
MKCFTFMTAATRKIVFRATICALGPRQRDASSPTPPRRSRAAHHAARPRHLPQTTRREEVIATLGYQATGSPGAAEAVEIPCADGEGATRYQRTQQPPHHRRGHRGYTAARRRPSAAKPISNDRRRSEHCRRGHRAAAERRRPIAPVVEILVVLQTQALFRPRPLFLEQSQHPLEARHR